MNRCADQRVPNIVRKAMAVQKIRLLPLGDLPQALVQLPQGFSFLINLFRRFGGDVGNRLHAQQSLFAGEHFIQPDFLKSQPIFGSDHSLLISGECVPNQIGHGVSDERRGVGQKLNTDALIIAGNCLQYFYCFGCGASGDAIDLAARLFSLSSYDAAKKLAADFGITEQKPSILARLQRGKSQVETERHCFRVLGDYLRILQDWKEHCAPQSPEDAIDPRYAEACHMLERIGNMLDILACGSPQERAEVVADLQKDERLMRMEARNRQIKEDEHGTK